MASLREHLGKRPLVLDGAMGSELLLGLPSPPPPCATPLERLSLEDPARVRAVHDAYLRAGCDLVTTHSFLGLRADLAPFGLGERTAELARAAARLARAAVDAHAWDGHPRFVLGSIGPGRGPAARGSGERAELAADHAELGAARIEGGVDGFLLETCRDPARVEAALAGLDAARRGGGRDLPILVSIFPEPAGDRGRAGRGLAPWGALLGSQEVDLVALNCTDGPDALRQPLAELARLCRKPLGAYPNAGAPSCVEGRARPALSPAQFAAELAPLALGQRLALVGGCCGAGPAHMVELIRALGRGPRS